MKRYIKNYTIFFSLGMFFFAGISFLCRTSKAADDKTILVAAASNLKFAMDDIIQLYTKNRPDTRIKISYGSSGNLFNQILNGAPFDLYFSADPKYPEELKKKHFGNEVVNYAFGQIVLMVVNDLGIKVQSLGIKSLFHPSIRKIAIANPVHAPYGRAAVAFMKKQNIYKRLKKRLVIGENISQAAQFVDSGAAEAGIVALSVAIKAKELGHVFYWKIPSETYPPIEQGFIILERTKKHKLVKNFTDFLQGRAGKKILVKYGFSIPKSVTSGEL